MKSEMYDPPESHFPLCMDASIKIQGFIFYKTK